jgi:nucleoside-diphosphate-sugar epimerase
MRFDIVLNDLCALAWTTRRIVMVSDGSPWRPLVHILDICEAIHCALRAPADAVRGKVFNVGQDSDNYRVREIAQIVASEFPGCEVIAGPPSKDNRSYRVSFARIHRELPGLEAAIALATAHASSASSSSASSSARATSSVPSRV